MGALCRLPGRPDTEIGRLGIMTDEGSYPENARALALNCAEVIYRASYPHAATGNEYFEIQSGSRALDNNVYVVAPNMGTDYLFAEENTPIDTFGGRSYIINYRYEALIYPKNLYLERPP